MGIVRVGKDRGRGARAAAWAAALALLAGSAGVAGSAAAEDTAALRARAKALLGVLPKDAASPSNPSTPERVALGRVLFHDPRLSKGQAISCNSCHDLARYGVDGEPTSEGHKGQRGARNSPTVYNAALEFAQFWDGREPDVESQAGGPMMNPVEMAMPGPAGVDALLVSIPGYAPLFRSAFPGSDQPVTFDNARLAIAAFERTLVTPGPFDAFLEGDDGALDETQKRGLATFLEVGCPTCHMTATVGGQMFQKLGLVHPYETKDLGRYQVTKNEADKYFFKVPMLRNVAKTAPYFHDGSIATLPEAVRKMAWHQLGRELTDAQVADIVAFLGSLTGPLRPEWTVVPELPASGPGTPKPDNS
jgi:cytochrome c peroxidase